MKVSTTQPFQIIYSLFKHEYLGYLFESFAVQVNSLGKLTLQHQNISHKNAFEFAKGLDERDYELIERMDSIQQDQIITKFLKKRESPDEFFFRVYDKNTGDKLLQETISRYIEDKLSEILSLIGDKRVFIMGKNGEPTWKEVFPQKEKATVLFHFRKNEENTHYFPTIKYKGEKLDFQYNGSKIICNHPAWMLVDDKLLSFEKNVDGKKLKPFLNKKFIVVPKKVEPSYYQNFIRPLIENYDVYAKGFDIITDHFDTKPILTLSEISGGASVDLFNQKVEEETLSKVMISLSFQYGDYNLSLGSNKKSVSVRLESADEKYTFHRIKRLPDSEEELLNFLTGKDLSIKSGKVVLPSSKAFSWISKNIKELEAKGFEINQKSTSQKKYFIGEASIEIEVKENNDWFDIYGVVKFGEFEIPFIELKKYITTNNKEFVLPDGSVAVIPEEWFTQYAELFAFSHGEDELKLKRHHISLVQELGENNALKLALNRKLENLKEVEKIDEYPAPEGFKGELREYQKAGYNWLNFLEEYNFGGCLADDMGLGKTVQTLAFLQRQKETKENSTSLLVLPTSLVYNWQAEAKKFAPNLSIMLYTATNRLKRPELFNTVDLVITTYGIVRLDVDILSKFYFNYVILDESQNIKNPNANISQDVRKLKSRRRLILTGTPVENSTTDLWSQITFVNEGLLGSLNYFKKEFQTPIEKKKDEHKTERLRNLVKPFILRRKKTQVAHELPDKIEKIVYCEMTTEQEKRYEETKSHYRNAILEQIEKNGLGKSSFMILQGLMKLRQISNHPLMEDESYEGSSGKLDSFRELMKNALDGNHKVLVFSQFVKHLDILKQELESQNIRFAYLDGTTKDRKKEVDKFQSDEDLRVFLISLKAGGVGLNLTAADYVFMIDPWWNPAVEAQAVDRAHRIGQKNTVFNYKFITKNTVEEKILQLQQQKLKMVNDLITVDESVIKNLSKEDIENILT